MTSILFFRFILLLFLVLFQNSLEYKISIYMQLLLFIVVVVDRSSKIMFKFHKIMQQKSFPYKTHTRTHARTTHSIRHNFLVYSVLSHTQQSIIINQKLFQIEKQYYRISLKKYKIKKFLSIFIMFAINASQQIIINY